ncbi:unnamed protein product [Cylicocyclus nassatus]|uniref:Uncharacterized protein n=1 Tax=Cylicocyclus nassatus TaxID=53992 RepID=A0AA36DNZ0_CYLNA|nr:unnamed protein product [Cylicocyclus nassatus]
MFVRLAIFASLLKLSIAQEGLVLSDSCEADVKDKFEKALNSTILSRYSRKNQTTEDTSTKHTAYVTANSKTDPLTLPSGDIDYTSGTWRNVSEVAHDIIKALDARCPKDVKIIGVDCFASCYSGYEDVGCSIFTTADCPERPEQELQEKQEENDSQREQHHEGQGDEHHEGQGHDAEQLQQEQVAETAQAAQQPKQDGLQEEDKNAAEPQMAEQEERLEFPRPSHCPLDIGGCAKDSSSDSEDFNS